MDKDGQQTTLRDQLATAFDEHEKTQEISPETSQTAEGVETAEAKAERLRDDEGRFTKQESQSAKIGKTEVPAVNPEAEVKRPPRPSSWKKEMWDHWEKLDPKVAEYLNQREQDFAKGVSTYKQEWESAKPLLDAMAQFQPILDQHGIKPSEWISNLGNAHHLLAMGSPEQKLSMFVKLAQDYQVPLQGMFTRGQDGQIYLNPQIQAWQAPQANSMQSQPHNVDQIIEEKLSEREAQREVQSFINNKEQYPHLEQVKDTMAGILQAGLAPDLKTAYDAALRMPQHTELFDELQKKQTAKLEQEKRDKVMRETQAAKAKAVSTKSSTPAGGEKGERKGLRGTISSIVDEVGTSRV